MTGPWAGRYYSGRTAKPHAVGVTLEAQRLMIRGDDPPLQAEWPAEEVRLIAPPDRKGPLRLGRAGGSERLTLSSPDALALLDGHCPRLRSAAYGGPGWCILLPGCLAALAGAAFLYFIALPFAASQAPRWISPGLEAKLGRQTADSLIRVLGAAARMGGGECANPAGLAALGRLAGPLAAQTAWTNPPRIRVVDTPMVNAFALPGGQILLMRGLVDFAADPNEVAGVIAHELGHLALGHPLELAIERGGRSFLIGLLLGDVLGGSALAGIGHAALEARYSREAERAADERAIAFLAGAGLDPRPYGQFFARLAGRGGGPIPLLDDHPSGQDRAKLIATLPAGGGSALPPAEWRALKAVCGTPALPTRP